MKILVHVAVLFWESKLAQFSEVHIHVLTMFVCRTLENADAVLGQSNSWVVCLDSLTKYSTQPCPEAIVNEQPHVYWLLFVVLCIYLSRTMYSLGFNPAYPPAAVFWMVAEDKDSWIRDKTQFIILCKNNSQNVTMTNWCTMVLSPMKWIKMDHCTDCITGEEH